MKSKKIYIPHRDERTDGKEEKKRIKNQITSKKERNKNPLSIFEKEAK